MDALRKAEEAKKKAELDSKSKSDPVLADIAAVDEPDEFVTGLETLPAIHPLIDDLAADDDLTSDTSRAPEVQVPFLDQEFQASTSKLDDEDATDIGLDELFTLDSGSATDLEADAHLDAEIDTDQPSAVEQFPGYTNAVNFRVQDKVDTENSSVAFADADPEIPEVTVASASTAGRKPGSMAVTSARFEQPAVPVSRADSGESGTPRIRVQQTAQSAKPETQDPPPEDRLRKSARGIFAAKRSRSTLNKNVQVTTLGVAAVLIMAIGIYFYINLRTGSGIGMPLADSEYQQTQRQYTDAELEMDDADLGIAAVETVNAESPTEIATTQEPAINLPEIPVAALAQPATADVELNIAEPVIVTEAEPAQTSLVTQIEPEPENVAVAPATTPAPVRSGDTAALTTTNSTAPASADATTVVTAEPAAELIPSVSTASPTSAAAGVVATVAGITAPDSVASTAAALQPEIVQPESLVSFTRRVSAPAGNPLIENAYIAYQNGNLEQAELLYREALTDAPLNRSALLGLAAIAASRNDAVAALDLYSKLLARDPNDPVAKAGILEIMPGGSLQEQEAELRRLHNQHPDIAPLAYAYGNFLASQQRWSEAQRAYFSALQLAKNDARNSSVNPDYAFNLAVSLEHLGQPRSAGNYYQEALTLAESHPAGFNLGLARERLSRTEAALNE